MPVAAVVAAADILDCIPVVLVKTSTLADTSMKPYSVVAVAAMAAVDTAAAAAAAAVHNY